MGPGPALQRCARPGSIGIPSLLCPLELSAPPVLPQPADSQPDRRLGRTEASLRCAWVPVRGRAGPLPSSTWCSQGPSAPGCRRARSPSAPGPPAQASHGAQAGPGALSPGRAGPWLQAAPARPGVAKGLVRCGAAALFSRFLRGLDSSDVTDSAACHRLRSH